MPNDMSPMPAPTQAGGAFDLFAFLEGQSSAWGLFEDRGGIPKRTFEIATDGRWDGETFILDEVFLYDDGEREARRWTFRPATRQADTDSRKSRDWIGTCPECVGSAKLTLNADSAEMSYIFRLKLKSRSIDLTFHDRFYPIGELGVMNRTDVTKFGIRVGEVTAFFGRGQIGLANRRPELVDQIKMSA